MRSKAKLIVPIGLVVAIAAAGLSLASGGGGNSNGSSDSAGSFTPVANGAAGNARNKRGPRRFRREFLDQDVHAVLEDIRAAVAKQASEIADPIIDKAESDGKITKAQADKLRQAAADVAAGKRPDLRALGRDENVEQVIHDAFAAAGKKAPAIGEPIIGKALDDKKITEAQANQIRDMLKRGPAGPGFERHGPGFGPPPIGDKDVVAVLDGVRAAVAKQAPGITNPIIDKAESDGKITKAQADKLRETTKSLTAGKRPQRRLDLDLRDADVRAVVHDAFEAVAKQTPKIAKPIIDKAVGDKKITQKQADQITEMLSHRIEFGGHGPGPGGPGRGHRPPPGFGPPGGPPPGQAPGSSQAPATPSVPSSPA